MYVYRLFLNNMLIFKKVILGHILRKRLAINILCPKRLHFWVTTMLNFFSDNNNFLLSFSCHFKYFYEFGVWLLWMKEHVLTQIFLISNRSIRDELRLNIFDERSGTPLLSLEIKLFLAVPVQFTISLISWLFLHKELNSLIWIALKVFSITRKNYFWTIIYLTRWLLNIAFFPPSCHVDSSFPRRLDDWCKGRIIQSVLIVQESSLQYFFVHVRMFCYLSDTT